MSKVATVNGKGQATAIGGVELVELPRPKIVQMRVKVVGVSPLIMHKWSDKAKKMILDKQMKTAQKGRDAKDPEQDYQDSMHKDDDGDYAFPSIAFKAAAVTACSQLAGVTKVFARGAFHIDGEYVKIEGKPNMREDMVRIGMGVADIRYRAEFKEWSAEIPVRYNAGVISKEQIVNLFQLAGFAVGIGEWRPEKDGSYGMFRLAEDGE